MRRALRGSTVGVIGLGLMGGSLARELAASGARVLGFDADPGTIAAAVEAAVLDGVLDPDGEGLEDIDLLILAVPVDRAAQTIARVAPHLGGDCVVTDVGSTKGSIERAATEAGIGPRFVGSHPLTGDHRSGWGASHRDLYAWQRVFLCPTPVTRPEALARVRALWEGIGALPEEIGAEEHDRRIAWTSHLPQLAASGLALALAGAHHPRHDLGPGGRDTTRLAASSPAMWTAICLDNAAHIAPALALFEERIRVLRETIARGDEPALLAFLDEASRWSEQQSSGQP